MALPLPSDAAAVPAREPRAKALLSRYADFWMLGGASIVVWALCRVLVPLAEVPGLESVKADLGYRAGWIALMSLVVNYPHFLASYRFAYGRGLRFLLQHWFALLAVPMALAELVWAGAIFVDDRSPGHLAVIAAINGHVQALGMNPLFSSDESFGRSLLTLLYLLMFVTVGWHYSKQVYGCVVTYAHLDEYRLETFQRHLLRIAILSVWWAYLAFMNSVDRFEEYVFLGVSPWLFVVAMTAFVVSTAAAVWLVFVRNWRERRQLPSWNMVVPWIAFAVWWLPWVKERSFELTFVPTFHGLQYLPFVMKAERSTQARRGADRAMLRFTLVALAILAAGPLAFDVLPNVLEHVTHVGRPGGATYFVPAIVMFINVHHFFIDAVIWRSKDPFVRENLLA